MSAVTPRTPTFGERLAGFARVLVSPRGAVFLLLIVLLVAITLLNPSFADPSQLIRFIQRVAPVAIVAIGQYFVIVGGEFDLSMGSVVTAQVVIAGNLIGQDDALALPVLAFMLAFGAFIGLVNGLIVSFLKVPSFIVTLGMMLALLGATLYWTGGAATGNPADSFRQIGRGGIRDIPVIDILPWSVVILVVILVVAILFARRPFRRLFNALGDKTTTARYWGARSWWVKTSS
jgi:ribose transport system permease protein